MGVLIRLASLWTAIVPSATIFWILQTITSIVTANISTIIVPPSEDFSGMTIKFGEAFGGDLEELHKMVNLLVVCCLKGDLKILGLCVPDVPCEWPWRVVGWVVAMRDKERALIEEKFASLLRLGVYFQTLLEQS